MIAFLYYSLTVSLVVICAIIWAICMCFIFPPSPASGELFLFFFFLFDWGVDMTGDIEAHGTQWGACHCWLWLLPLFSLLAFLWFSQAQWETIIKAMNHSKILYHQTVLFKSLSIFLVCLFILRSGKLHHYFPFNLLHRDERLFSALQEAILYSARFI